ncbi:18500_t:CDS:2 [Rhizophagus irregularis]|nr:18500_t:CDS:2 [Rhizophagus irregularis]
MKSTRFTEVSNIGIKNAVESSFPHFMNKRWQFFRHTSISDLEIACEPNFGWSVDALKRRKLYVGIVHDPIQMTSSLIYQPIRPDNITSEVSGIDFKQFLQQNFMSLNVVEFAM